MILAARIAIAKRWNQPTISFESVKYNLNWIVINDNLTSILTNTQLIKCGSHGFAILIGYSVLQKFPQ